MHLVANAYPIEKEPHRGVPDGEKVSKFIDEPSRLRVGNPKAPLIFCFNFIITQYTYYILT